MDRSAAYQTARQKSLYGHRSWLMWKTISGEWHAAREERDSLREAIKAQGEHGEQYGEAREDGEPPGVERRPGGVEADAEVHAPGARAGLDLGGAARGAARLGVVQADDDQAAGGELGVELAQGGGGAPAIRAGVGPEADQHDAAPQLGASVTAGSAQDPTPDDNTARIPIGPDIQYRLTGGGFSCSMGPGGAALPGAQLAFGALLALLVRRRRRR